MVIKDPKIIIVLAKDNHYWEKLYQFYGLLTDGTYRLLNHAELPDGKDNYPSVSISKAKLRLKEMNLK